MLYKHYLIARDTSNLSDEAVAKHLNYTADTIRKTRYKLQNEGLIHSIYVIGYKKLSVLMVFVGKPAVLKAKAVELKLNVQPIHMNQFVKIIKSNPKLSPVAGKGLNRLLDILSTGRNL